MSGSRASSERRNGVRAASVLALGTTGRLAVAAVLAAVVWAAILWTVGS